VRALFARLAPGAEIRPHHDDGFSLTNSHRVHLPVLTRPGVAFTVGGETRGLAAGELVEINNCRVHAVRNDSPAPRVHLIVDWVIPGERRFFRETPAARAHLRWRPGTEVDVAVGATPGSGGVARILTADGGAAAIDLEFEVLDLARYLAAQRGSFAALDVRRAATGLAPDVVHEILEDLVAAGHLEARYGRPF
jgi:hypothetical protein